MESQQTPENSQSEPSSALVPTKKSHLRRNVLIAGSAVGLIGIGSTLASNITINAGESVEFGQGVAETATCDTDITVTPVTRYDIVNSIFRLDRVEVSNLDLTPVGTGYSEGGFDTQAAAKAARPGEYYDTVASAWKRTCDGVVLDFKAYTDDMTYWSSTRDGSYGGDQTISSPVGWAQYQGNVENLEEQSWDFGFALIFDLDDDGLNYRDNYGVGDGANGNANDTVWDNFSFGNPANSSFSFAASYYVNDPNAASISKITVASMATFPTDYNLYETNGIGRG